MSEAEPKTTPFRIRGHHLWAFAELLRTTLSPSELAERVVEGIQYLRIERNEQPTEELDLEYIGDVLGTNPEQRDHFRKVQEDEFRKFLELPDDFPVEITTGKDALCKACAIGEHCSNEDMYGDKEDIARFIRDLKPGQRKKIESHRFVSTNLGLVRAILKGTNWDLAKPISQIGIGES